MERIMRNTSVLLVLITTILFVLGCAAKSAELMAEDYKNMSNENLLRYYYRLNDEIETQEKQTGPQFGFGMGGYGHHTASGIGVTTGGSGYVAEDLRARRIDVRLELKRRGITP